jgi:deoxyribodipyrimidine photo-lyase
MDFKFNKKRVRVLSKAEEVPVNAAGIIYWMSRDQRVQGKSLTVKFLKQNCSYLWFHFIRNNCNNLNVSEMFSCHIALFLTLIADNWAFLFAQKLAMKNKISLHVCFCLLPKFLDATFRHFKFMLDGKSVSHAFSCFLQ